MLWKPLYRRYLIMSKICFLVAVMLTVVSFVPDGAGADAEKSVPDTSMGGQVYVPVYPAIYYMGRKKSLELTVTLSIHNISPDSEIMVKYVNYFSKKGKLIRKMLDQPVKLAPLETTSFVVDEQKEQGGVGANFMVSWRAEREVNRPVIQAVMITTSGSQGISFITEGVPVRDITR